ncbi:hypothetical protein E2C01_089012 [Portunus trituberculatus]|uniref:Uncharacterized protein n=1 Tax=Portunus trituberculatus TaxID=210409 RepID=A0A5B7JL34_PORTR|nr:hypothetical protein [Portunus trituberculatus]
MQVEKPEKRKKKNTSGNLSTSLDSSLQSNGDLQSPRKKKKTKHLPQIANEATENSPDAEELKYPEKKIKKEHFESDSGNINSLSFKGKKKSKEKHVWCVESLEHEAELRRLSVGECERVVAAGCLRGEGCTCMTEGSTKARQNM